MASRRALGRRAMCRPLSSAPCVAGLRWILGVYAPLSIAGMGSLVRLWWRRAPGAAFPMAHLISDRATELGTLSLDGAGRAVSGEELLDFRGHPWWRSVLGQRAEVRNRGPCAASGHFWAEGRRFSGHPRRAVPQGEPRRRQNARRSSERQCFVSRKDPWPDTCRPSGEPLRTHAHADERMAASMGQDLNNVEATGSAEGTAPPDAGSAQLSCGLLSEHSGCQPVGLR